MNLSNITILTPSGTPEASLRYCAVAPIVVMSDYVKVHIPGSDSIETIVSGAISVEEIPATTLGDEPCHVDMLDIVAKFLHSNV